MTNGPVLVVVNKIISFSDIPVARAYSEPFNSPIFRSMTFLSIFWFNAVAHSYRSVFDFLVAIYVATPPSVAGRTRSWSN